MPRIRHRLYGVLIATCLASISMASAQTPAPSPTVEAQRQASSDDFCTRLRNARTPAERRALMHRMRDIRGVNEPGSRGKPKEAPGATMGGRAWRGMREMGCPDEGASAGTPVVKTQGNVTYVSGGIGQDEVESMRKMAPDYNLRLMFVGTGGEYLADIDTRIRAANGTVVLAVVSEGPLLYVRLPSGSYRVSATYNGVVRQAMVTVPAHRSAVRTVVWPR